MSRLQKYQVSGSINDLFNTLTSATCRMITKPVLTVIFISAVLLSPSFRFRHRFNSINPLRMRILGRRLKTDQATVTANCNRPYSLRRKLSNNRQKSRKTIRKLRSYLFPFNIFYSFHHRSRSSSNNRIYIVNIFQTAANYSSCIYHPYYCL